MAAFTSKATGFWDAAGQTTWNEVGTPGALDTVEIQVGDTVTLQQNEACTTLLMTDGALDLANFDLDVSGNYNQNGGDIDTGATGELTVTGNVLWAGGTVSVLNLTMDGTATLGWDSSEKITQLTIVSGAAITTSAHILIESLSGSGGLTTNHTLTITGAVVGWMSYTGTMDGTGNLTVQNETDLPNGDIIVGVDLIFRSTAVRAINIDGDIEADSITVFGDGGDKYTVTMAAGKSVTTAGSLTLGDTDATTGSGILNLASGTTNTIGSIVAGDPTNSANAIDFSDATVTGSGLYNFADIVAVTMNGSSVTCADMDVGTDCILTLNDDSDVTITGALNFFELASGTINTNTNTLSVDGNVKYTAGTVAELILEMTGTSTLGWDAPAEVINSLMILTGITVTSSEDIELKILSGSGDLVLDGIDDLIVRNQSSDDWWSHTGDITTNGSGEVRPINTTGSPGGDINISVELSFEMFGNVTIDVDANIAAAALFLENTAGNVLTLNMGNGQDLDISGAATLGDTAATTGSGVLTLGDGSTNSFDSITFGNAANTQNALTFGADADATAITFNGVDQDANVATPFNQFSSGTRYATIAMDFWLASDRAPTSIFLFDQSFPGNTLWLRVMAKTDETITLQVAGIVGDTLRTISGQGTILEDAWNKCIIQFDSTNDTVDMWLNGAKVTDGVAIPGGISPFGDFATSGNPEKQRFGNSIFGSIGRLKGRMRMMGIAGGNTAITDADVVEYTNNPESHLSGNGPDFPEYTSWYKGDEGSGTSVNNGESDPDHDLTLTSANQWINETSSTTITNAFDTSNIKTITSSGIITVPSVTIDSQDSINETTWTLASDTTISGDFTLQESEGVAPATTTIDTNGNTLTVGGSVLYVAADAPVVTEMNLTMTGTGETLGWSLGGTEKIDILTITGDITTSAVVYTRSFQGSGGSLVVDTGDLFRISDATANWWGYTGSQITGNGSIRIADTTTSPGGDIDTATGLSFVSSTGDVEIASFDGNITAVWLDVDAVVGDSYTITMAATKTITTPILRLGDTTGGSTGSGILTLASGTTNTIGSIVAGDPANLANAIDFSDATVTGSGLYNFADIVAVTMNGSTIACDDMDVGTDCVLTLDDDSSVEITGGANFFELASGTINTNGNTLSVDGNVKYTAGTVTELLLEMTGTTKTLGWNTATQGVTILTISGSATLSDTTWFVAIAGSGDIDLNDKSLIKDNVNVNDFWTLSGNITGPGLVEIRYQDSNSNNADINAGSATELTFIGGDDVLTVGHVTTDNIVRVRSFDAGLPNTLIIGGNLLCGSLEIGISSVNNRSGILTLGDGSANSIGSIAAGDAANLENALTFAGSTTITNAFDTSNITTINSAGIITVPSVTIDSTATNDTTWILDEDTTISGDFTLQETAGTSTIDSNGNTLSIGGSVEYVSTDTPTVTELNLTLTGATPTLGWNAGSPDYIDTLTLTGNTVTTTENINAVMLLAGSGEIVLDGTDRLFLDGSVGGEWWNYTGDITTNGTGYISKYHPTISPLVDINTPTMTWVCGTNGAPKSWPINVNVTVGNLKLSHADDDYTVTMAAGKNLVCDELTLGPVTADVGNTIFSLGAGTTNTINSIAAGNPVNNGNAIDFSDTTVTGSGLYDFANIDTVTMNGSFITCDDMDVGTDCILTLNDDSNVTISGGANFFELASGTINTNTNTLSVDGNVKYTAGTVTELILNMTGTSNLSWASSSANGITNLTLSGITTSDAEIRLDKILGSGNLSLGHNMVIAANPLPANWWSHTGDITGVGEIRVFGATVTPGNDISVSVILKFQANLTESVIITENITAPQLKILGVGANSQTITMSAASVIISGVVTLGRELADQGSGILTLADGTTNIIGSLVDGEPTNSANALNFGTSKVITSGTIDGNNIAVTSNAALIVNGTVTNVDNGGSPAIRAIDSVNGGANINVTFVVSTDDINLETRLILTKYGTLIQRPESAVDRLYLLRPLIYGTHPNPLNYLAKIMNK